MVDKRLAYMTPEWKDAFKYATTLADQLGMEEAIAGSPGWSETGGPWVPPARGHEEVRVERDRRRGRQAVYRERSPIRRRIPGRFRTSAIRDAIGAERPKPPQFYADAAVVAYRSARE